MYYDKNAGITQFFLKTKNYGHTNDTIKPED